MAATGSSKSNLFWNEFWAATLARALLDASIVVCGRWRGGVYWRKNGTTMSLDWSTEYLVMGSSLIGGIIERIDALIDSDYQQPRWMLHR